jgi:hypothetical protein
MIADRDPVCEKVEALLEEMEVAGDGAIATTLDRGSVKLRFGGLWAEGESYEIALVRLACVMIDDPRYRETVISALSGVLHSAEQAPAAIDCRSKPT